MPSVEWSYNQDTALSLLTKIERFLLRKALKGKQVSKFPDSTLPPELLGIWMLEGSWSWVPWHLKQSWWPGEAKAVEKAACPNQGSLFQQAR